MKNGRLRIYSSVGIVADLAGWLELGILLFATGSYPTDPTDSFLRDKASGA
jgi:hypothetical protein